MSDFGHHHPSRRASAQADTPIGDSRGRGGADKLPIMGTAVDISEGGAGLTVVSTNGIPDAFELQIKGEQARRSCKVVWKEPPHHLGVSFANIIEV
jgi:hypothetical protein